MSLVDLQLSGLHSTCSGGPFCHHNLTFKVEFPKLLGNVPKLEVHVLGDTVAGVAATTLDGTVVTNSQGRLECISCRQGENPADLLVSSVSASQLALVASELLTGEKYIFSVTALNRQGSSESVRASCQNPMASYCTSGMIRPPLQAPSMPQNVSVLVKPGDSSKLIVDYRSPVSDGGSPVIAYQLEWSEQSDFAYSSSKQAICDTFIPRDIFVVTVDKFGSLNSSDTFGINLAISGIVVMSLPIRVDAVDMTSSEVADVGSGIFCDPARAGCDQFPITNAGSMQSHLNQLPGVLVEVARAETHDSISWILTFTSPRDPILMSLRQSGSSDLINHMRISQQAIRPTSTAICTSKQDLADLRQGTPYFVRVTAYNKIGYGPSATAIGVDGLPFQAPMRQPGRVTAASVSVVSGTQLGVTWSPPTDSGGSVVVEYIIQQALDPTFTSELRSTSLTFISDGGPYFKYLSGLVTGTEYFVRIIAVNSQGNSTGQSTSPPSETPKQVPSAPLHVDAMASSDSMVTVKFALPASSGGSSIDRFRVDWDTDIDFEGLLSLPHRGSVIVRSSSHSSYTVTDLMPNVAYYVRVSAGNSVGFGAATDIASGSVKPKAQVPGRPSSIVVASVSCGGQILVRTGSPIIPAHGVPCSGAGTLSVSAGSCPMGMATDRQADGGRRVLAYEVQWSAFADFHDTMSDGGTTLIAVPASANQHGPHEVVLSPSVGTMLPDKTYFVRVAARNANGAGPYCAASGTECDGMPLEVQSSPAC
jgi:hypothetical protein